MVTKFYLVFFALLASTIALPLDASIKKSSRRRRNSRCSPDNPAACGEGLTCVVSRGQRVGACLNLERTNPFLARALSAQALAGDQGDACHADVPGHCESGNRCLFAINPANGRCQNSTRFDPPASPSPVQITGPPTDDQPCNPYAEIPCADDLTCIFVRDNNKRSEGVCKALEKTNPFVARVIVATVRGGRQGDRCHASVPRHCSGALQCLFIYNRANGSCTKVGY